MLSLCPCPEIRARGPRDQFFGFQRFRLSANGAFVISLFPLTTNSTHTKRGSVCNPLDLYSIPPRVTLLSYNRILRHHESQRLEFSPMRHLINVPPCRYSLIPPYASKSHATFPKLLGYDIRKGEWNSAVDGECR